MSTVEATWEEIEATLARIEAILASIHAKLVDRDRQERGKGDEGRES